MCAGAEACIDLLCILNLQFILKDNRIVSEHTTQPCQGFVCLPVSYMVHTWIQDKATRSRTSERVLEFWVPSVEDKQLLHIRANAYRSTSGSIRAVGACLSITATNSESRALSIGCLIRMTSGNLPLPTFLPRCQGLLQAVILADDLLTCPETSGKLLRLPLQKVIT